MLFVNLLKNMTLLLALAIPHRYLVRRLQRGSLAAQLAAGSLFTAVTLIGMRYPYTWTPGVVFDPRSVFASVCGAFYGPAAAGMVAVGSSIYRLRMGGAGAWTGVGVVCTSAALGVAYYYWRRRQPSLNKLAPLLGLGVVVHLLMLAWMFTLPWPLPIGVLRGISLPVMLIFPLGTMVLGGLLADEEAHQEAQQHLQRSNRALRLLSNCNQTVVRAPDVDVLLNTICQLIVREGGYRLAWVAFAEHDHKKSVRPVAQAGFEQGYLETLNITWADEERGQGPTGTAIRTGKPAVARNILRDPTFAPWREAAVQRGYGSSAALPLTVAGDCFGALNVYSAHPEAFDDREVELLQELATDLAFGIATLRARRELERAREEWETIFQAIGHPTLILGPDYRIVRANDAAARVVGIGAKELEGQLCCEVFHGAESHPADCPLANLLSSGKLATVEMQMETLNGVFLVTCTPVPGDHEQIEKVIHIATEITGRVKAEQARERLTQRLQLLHDIDRAILAAESPGDIARSVVLRLSKLAPCRRAEVVLFDFERRESQVIAFDTKDDAPQLREFARPLTHFGDADELAAADVAHVDDIATLPGSSEVVAELARSDIRSYVSVALRADAQIIGLLNIAAEEPGALTEEHVEIAKEVADSQATALQVARHAEEIQRAQTELRELSRQLVAAQEQERRRIAYELHDEIGQALTGIKVELEGVRQLPDESLRSRLAEMRGLVVRLMSQVRNLSLDFRPTALDHLGLVAAVRSLLSRYTDQTGVQVRLIAEDNLGRFPESVEIAAYRIIQEALTNVARHANTMAATVTISREGEALFVRVEDRGDGFHPQRTRKPSLGLTSMRERATMLGGDLRVTSKVGSGTTVEATLPVSGEARPMA